MIDPWATVVEREAVVLAFLNNTRIPLFCVDNLGNIQWGTEIITLWEITSDRQKSKYSVRIDETAWYACVNYLVTVVPYLAAMNSKLYYLRRDSCHHRLTHPGFQLYMKPSTPNLLNIGLIILKLLNVYKMIETTTLVQKIFKSCYGKLIIIPLQRHYQNLKKRCNCLILQKESLRMDLPIQ